MKDQIISEEEFRSLTLNESDTVVYLKIVNLAPSAIQKIGKEGNVIADLMPELPGYFMSSSNSEELREAMHSFIDIMFDTVEKTNEQKQN